MPEQKISEISKISDQLWGIIWDMEHAHSIDKSPEKILARLKPVLDRIEKLEDALASDGNLTAKLATLLLKQRQAQGD